MSKSKDKDSIISELGEINRKLINREAELKKREYYLKVYNEIVSTLIRSTELKPALLNTLEHLCEVTKSEMGVIFLYDRKRDILYPFSGISCRRDLPSFKMGEGAVGICAKEGKTLTFAHIPPDTPFKIVNDGENEKKPEVILLTPLLKKDEIFGILLMASLHSFSVDDIKLVERISIQLTIFIDNSLKFKRIFDLAQELKERTIELKRKYVELEKLYYEKSKLFASISHEFKTPLNSILGFSKILLKEIYGELNPKQKEFLQYIYKNGNLLLSLIEDLLSIARIERGAEKLSIEEVDLKKIVEDSIKHLSPLVEKKGIEVKVEIDENLKGIKADPRKLKQIFFNLITNALKFSRENGKIEIGAFVGEYGDEVKIYVRDYGEGIEKDEIQKIFEPFYRGEKSEGGTGLGLYLTKRLVELHRGRIWVESQKGVGSTFFFTLPVNYSSEDGVKIVKMRF